MDTEVNKPFPQGNALAGFAEKKQPPWLMIGLIAISALVLVGAAFGFLGYFLSKELPTPKNQAVLFAVRGRTDLPSFLPTVWRKAAKASGMPVILGLSKDADKWNAFAITDRFTNFDASNIESIGLLKISSDAPVEKETQRDPAEFLSALSSLVLHQAFLRIDGKLLLKLDAPILSGPIDDGVWHTDAKIQKSSLQDGTQTGDVFVDLTSFPEAWPTIDQSLRQSTGIEIDEAPSAISLDLKDGKVSGTAISFQKPPADSTVLRLAGSIGIFDLVPYTLPDNSVVLELTLPKQQIGQAMSSTDPDKWKNLSVANGNIMLHAQSQKTSAEKPCAPGKLVFRLSGTALKTVLNTLNSGPSKTISTNGRVPTLELHEDAGILTACLK